MKSIRFGLSGCLLALVLLEVVTHAEPPLCTTHFFDWYVVSEQSPLQHQQRRWTYPVDWGAFDITPEEIGNSVHYYEVQFRKIKEAGFDGVHYEWHNNQPKDQFLEAARNVDMPLAMFYDMQIRFHRRTAFITPTDKFADEVVADVVKFYRRVPKALWLHDRNGNLPLIVYGYAFDQSITDPKSWDTFYRSIIRGIEGQLGERVVLHWTNTNTPQQMYGFQHFPQIQSYIFNEASGQTQTNAHSVTFVVHYDDLGVSFAREGPRQQRWIRNDIRYLQESLWLAKHTNPDLVFNYGWNELYEGEHLFPDACWGTWRYEVAAAMVKAIKAETTSDLPRALIIADDFLPAWHDATPEKTRMLRRQMSLLTRLRAFVPQADVVLPGSGVDFDQYDFIFSLNSVKDEAEEDALEASGKRVVYANPEIQHDSPIMRRFTALPRAPLRFPDLGPVNEYVIISRAVDVDLARYPMLSYRCRNSDGTVFHIRYHGITESGQEVAAWFESSPTDDRQTQGQWMEKEVNVAQIAQRGAGQRIGRLSRIEIILDDLEQNGEFSLDMDYLRLTDTQGNIGWEDEFTALDGWTCAAAFGGQPQAASRYGFAPTTDADLSVGRMTLKAISSNAPTGPIDEATRMIQPRDEVRTVFEADFNDTTLPIVLQAGSCYFLNTYSPTEDCWKAFIPDLLGMGIQKGVLFRSYSYAARDSGLTASTDTQWTIIQQEELPLERIRLVAPPELNQPTLMQLPVSSRPLTYRVVRGERKTIPLRAADKSPGTITLQPGEIVDLVREE